MEFFVSSLYVLSKYLGYLFLILSVILILVRNLTAKRNNYPRALPWMPILYLVLSLVTATFGLSGYLFGGSEGGAVLLAIIYLLLFMAVSLVGLIMCVGRSSKGVLFIVLFVLGTAILFLPVGAEKYETYRTKVESGEVGGITKEQAIDIAHQKLDNQHQYSLVVTDFHSARGAAQYNNVEHAEWVIVYNFTKPDGLEGSHAFYIDATDGAITYEMVN